MLQRLGFGGGGEARQPRPNFGQVDAPVAAVARTLQKHLAENDSAEEAAHWTAVSEAFKSGGCTRLHGDLRSLQQAVQNYEKQGGQSFWAELLPFACSQALRFDELFPEPIAIVEETVAGKVCTRACERARRLPPFPHTSPYQLKPSRCVCVRARVCVCVCVSVCLCVCSRRMACRASWSGARRSACASRCSSTFLSSTRFPVYTRLSSPSLSLSLSLSLCLSLCTTEQSACLCV